MIQTEQITINDADFVHTYSDTAHMIERNDGARFADALDPINSGRTYTETDELIDPPTEEDYAQAGRIMLGVE